MRKRLGGTCFAMGLALGMAAACNMEEMRSWDWFGLKPAESKERPITRASPGGAAPAFASDEGEGSAAKDPQVAEVDERVERYVRSMNQTYDSSYESNDFNSKMRRQRDPNRAGRIQRTVAKTSPQAEPASARGANDSAAAPARIPETAARPEPMEGAPTADQLPPTAEQTRAAQATPRVRKPEPPQIVEPEPKAPPKQELARGEPASSHDSIEAGALEPEATKTPAPVEREARSASTAEAAAAATPRESAPTRWTSPVPRETEPGRAKETPAKPSTGSPAGANGESPEPVKVAGKDAGPAVADKREAVPVKEPPKAPILSGIKVTPSPQSSVEPTGGSQRMAGVEPARAKPIDSPPTPTKANAAPAREASTSGDGFKSRLKALEAEAAKNPNDVEAQFRLRLMYVLDGQDEKALAPVEGMNEEMQEVFRAQMQVLLGARASAQRDPALWANQQMESIEALRAAVRSRADLYIPRVALCTAIEGFGRYEPIEPPHFKVGERNRLLVYIEVQNFRSEKTSSGNFRTLLSLRPSLVSKNGEELWADRDDNIEDLSRQRRTDFFLTIGPLAIPKTLGPGEYVFKVEVEDVLGQKINSGSTTFKMVP